ncbi:hypothetical protein [Armatimonas sp.]|uniref:hypothetical protein n=1 Tax=Armatimonas sp. TaxID=1872638 RepID=UPI00286A1C47|nr:hypothetical protein [Armatimonas sp.]
MGTWREQSIGTKFGCIAVAGLFGAVFISEFAHVISSARLMPRKQACHETLEDLSRALLAYAEEHKNHLPDAAHWREAIRTYLKPGKLVVCLDAKIGDGYAMEPRLSKVNLDALENPPETILLYETDAPDQKPRPPLTKTRHGAPNIAFADGHVKYGYGEYQQKLHERSDALLTGK